MDPVREWHPRGPSGIKDRMVEIQEKMDAILGSVASDGTFYGSVLAPFMIDQPGVSLQPTAKALAPSPDIAGMIDTAAKNNNVDPHLLSALVSAESSYQPNARSAAGAVGLTQLMPSTAVSMGVTDLADPMQNLNGGAKYLRSLLDKYGDVSLALAAYNAGPGAVDRYGGIPPFKETQNYVQRILADYAAKSK
jgi:soluble lytic murein transglycosylase-like protein